MSVSTVTSPAATHHSGTDAANALPMGHRLHEFELRGVIGVGGFGIVYRAFDHSLEREVAIKEYLPAALAGRSGKQQVSLLSASHSETFALGMSSFVNEAKLLARFDHPSLLKVHRFWEDNGTAYMVMPLYRGRTLRQLRQGSGRCPDGAWLMRLVDQLLGALDVMHREGVYHRDIAPDNVIVANDAPPVLLDFGAARRVISDRSQTLTAILKPSYAPLEQYAESTGMRQGPWTDFYALGATLHFVITGKPPVPATARALSDEQPLLAGAVFGDVPDLLLQVCDWMLAPRPHDRPQHVAELRAALAGHLPVPRRERAASASAWATTVVQQPAAPSPAAGPEPGGSPAARVRKRRWGRGVPLWGTAVAMVFAAGSAWWLSNLDDDAPAVTAAFTAAAQAAPVPAPTVPAPTTASVAQPAPADVPSADAAEPAAAPVPRTRAAAASRVGPRVAEGRAAGARAREAVAAAPAAAVVAPPDPEPVVHNEATPPPAAPAQAPVSVASVTRNPREQCAGRHLVAMHRWPSRVQARARDRGAHAQRARQLIGHALGRRASGHRRDTPGFHTMR
jgi:non-specific serine/threonine protein kinase